MIKLNNITTYLTKYGVVSLYSNEVYISNPFKHGDYWDEDTLIKLKNYIDPNKSILEIGSHCGTSSLIYASYLNNDQKLYAFEPQKNMYNLLVQNINQNNLKNKIIPYNKAVFCFNGIGHMNDIDIDGGGGNVLKRYNEETNLPCNYGGICLGVDGEEVEFTTVDNMDMENIGYMHIDAQGAENFILSKAINLITKCKPVIYFENNEKYDRKLYDKVCLSYPEYKEESKFDIKDYCMNKLGYTKIIEKFNGGNDDLIIA
jgi:FkbM family methyltransferase